MSALTTGLVGMLPFLVGTMCVILGGWAGDRLIAAGWRVTLVRKGFAVGGLFGATVFTIAGAYTPDDVLAITLPDAVGREPQLLDGGGELHADRRGAAPYRLLAGVAAEFRRECRRVLRAARHRPAGFGGRGLHRAACSWRPASRWSSAAARTALSSAISTGSWEAVESSMTRLRTVPNLPSVWLHELTWEEVASTSAARHHHRPVRNNRTAWSCRVAWPRWLRGHRSAEDAARKAGVLVGSSGLVRRFEPSPGVPRNHLPQNRNADADRL